MRPSSMMWLGSVVGVMALIASVAGHDVTVLALAAGALFGKSYGIWEARDAE